MKAYPRYKESGVPWLENVPAHWECKALRTTLKQRNEKNNPVKTEQILSLSIAHGVTLYSHEGRGGNKNKGDLTAYKIAHAGDIVLNSMNVIVGAVGLSKYTGAISPVYYALYPATKSVDITYYEKIFRNAAFQRFLLIYGKGILIKKSSTGKLNTIRMKISPDDLKGTVLPIPPFSEQQQISRFLDWQTSKINKFIKAKKKLITLLQEQRQNVIYNAVTKGIQPEVKLKSSGVLWVGDTPAHWSLTVNRGLFRIRKVLVGARHEEFNLLSLTKGGVIVRDMSTGKGKFSNFWDRSQEVRPGDLVFCLFDVDETPRTVGLSKYHGMISPDYTVMECFDKNNATFLEYFFKAMDDRKLLRPLYTGLRKRISKPLLLASKTPLPPPDEQKAIVRHIDKMDQKTEYQIKRINKEIELIQEYRTRLISDVVTGKVDVRSVEIPNFEPIEADLEVQDNEESDDELIAEGIEE